MTAPPLKEWVCFIYNNETCKGQHFRMRQPNWKGDKQPAGHDRCGWFEIAEQGDKGFGDE